MKTIALLFLVCGISCLAQSAELAFEAASVRLADPNGSSSGQGIQTSPGALTIHHSALSTCILFAWQFQNAAQLIGPDWIHDVRLDIVAKAPAPAGDAELALMLRTLLRERMGVTAHLEKRETLFSR